MKPSLFQSTATMFRAAKIYTMEADSVYAGRPAVGRTGRDLESLVPQGSGDAAERGF